MPWMRTPTGQPSSAAHRSSCFRSASVTEMPRRLRLTFSRGPGGRPIFFLGLKLTSLVHFDSEVICSTLTYEAHKAIRDTRPTLVGGLRKHD